MGKKAIYCLGACLLAAQMSLSAVLPCYAAQIGSGATVESVEEKSFITSVTISPGTTVVSKDTKCSFTAYVAGVNDYIVFQKFQIGSIFSKRHLVPVRLLPAGKIAGVRQRFVLFRQLVRRNLRQNFLRPVRNHRKNKYAVLLQIIHYSTCVNSSRENDVSERILPMPMRWL